MQKSIEQFKKLVTENFSQKNFRYHQWMVAYHLEIAERIALELCARHPDADRDVVQVLVWFHDFGKPMENEKNEREITLREGPRALLACGFGEVFIEKVVQCWELMEKKSEIDLRTAPIETQIVSSADGASHLVGMFYSSYFGVGHDFATTQKRLKEKMEKDWERKIVLPEVTEAFETRYRKAREMLGEFPETFLKATA